MKTTIKAIYAVLAVLILAMAAVTSNGTPSELFASVNGARGNGQGSIVQYSLNGMQSTLASGLSHPRGLAFDNEGNLFVATTFVQTPPPNGRGYGTIFKISPDGVQSLFATVDGIRDVSLEDLAFDGAGNLFVVAIDNHSRTFASTIFKFDPDGTQSTFGALPSQSFGLAFDSAGNLFAACAGCATIYKFAPDGTPNIFADPSAFPSSLGPRGLAFDRFGNLFVSAVGAVGDPAVILKFTPGGVQSIFATGFNEPSGLAFDTGGNLYLAEIPSFATGDILKFTPGGARTVFASGIGSPRGLGGPTFLAFRDDE